MSIYCVCVRAFEHVLNAFMAQLNLSALISVPNLRQLIRSHVLEQTLKTAGTKEKHTNQAKPAKTKLKTGLKQPQSTPSISPSPAFRKRSAVRQKAVKQTGGDRMALLSRAGTIPRIISKPSQYQ